MKARPLPKDDYEEKLLAQVDKHGWSVTSVFDPKQELPDFSYSIGIFETLKMPEVLVIGQKTEVSFWMVNEYGRRLRGGETFSKEGCYGGFLKDFNVTFLEADATVTSEDYTRSAKWFYQGTTFPLFQIVWPNLAGAFPWDIGWPIELDKKQPVLGELPTTRMN